MGELAILMAILKSYDCLPEGSQFASSQVEPRDFAAPGFWSPPRRENPDPTPSEEHPPPDSHLKWVAYSEVVASFEENGGLMVI